MSKPPWANQVTELSKEEAYLLKKAGVTVYKDMKNNSAELHHRGLQNWGSIIDDLDWIEVNSWDEEPDMDRHPETEEFYFILKGDCDDAQ